MTKALLSCLLVFVFAPLCLAQQQPATSSQISELRWFVGHWNCEGKFASGKSISANASFEATLDDHWILFRHDDNPPFNYHALSEWGWSDKSQQFVSLIQDSGGGARAFYSSGWTGAKLRWEGGAFNPDQAHSERFEFSKLDNDAFQVAYSYFKDGKWISVDASKCTRVNLSPSNPN